MYLSLALEGLMIAAGYYQPSRDQLDRYRIDHLRRRSLTVGTMHEPGDWLHTSECLDVVRDGWRACGEWNAWLRRHVGPAVGEPPG